LEDPYQFICRHRCYPIYFFKKSIKTNKNAKLLAKLAIQTTILWKQW